MNDEYMRRRTTSWVYLKVRRFLVPVDHFAPCNVTMWRHLCTIFTGLALVRTSRRRGIALHWCGCWIPARCWPLFWTASSYLLSGSTRTTDLPYGCCWLFCLPICVCPCPKRSATLYLFSAVSALSSNVIPRRTFASRFRRPFSLWTFVKWTWGPMLCAFGICNVTWTVGVRASEIHDVDVVGYLWSRRIHLWGRI